MRNGKNCTATWPSSRAAFGMRHTACALLALVSAAFARDSFPPPFSRPLYLAAPPLGGKDVYILQNLLRRATGGAGLNVSSVYDQETADVVANFNRGGLKGGPHRERADRIRPSPPRTP